MTERALTDKHLMVAVLTYRRPAELAALLPRLALQGKECASRTGAAVSVLVVDNDPAQSAAHLVTADQIAEPRTQYAAEPKPGIAAARNRALDEADAADLLAFIDDDEMPNPGWLSALAEAYVSYEQPAGVVGPVVSEFAVPPRRWVAAGCFFDRQRHATGAEVQIAASNNLLLDMTVVRKFGVRFDERFGISGGSDTLFSHELVTNGGRLVWCDEALVVDQVPAGRVSARWVLQRALRSGNSWSRTLLALPLSPPERLRRKGVLTGRGVLRVAGGLAQFFSGLVIWSMRRQARGLRTAARGVGMLIGAYGMVYSEYRRPGQGS
jgi:glycosyltransferase involved in cell wall biosynthesis